MASEMEASGMLLVETNHSSKLGYACQVAAEMARRRGEYNVECKISVHLHPDLKMVSGVETVIIYYKILFKV